MKKLTEKKSQLEEVLNQALVRHQKPVKEAQAVWAKRLKRRQLERLLQEEARALAQEREEAALLRGGLSQKHGVLVEAQRLLTPTSVQIQKAQTQELQDQHQKLLGSLHYENKIVLEKILSIFPIKRLDQTHCTIMGIKLPDDCFDLDVRCAAGAFDNETVAAALGYLVHTMLCFSTQLELSLPHSMLSRGSRSEISFRTHQERFLLCPTGAGGDAGGAQQADSDAFQRAITLLDENVQMLAVEAGRTKQSLKAYELLPTMLSAVEAVHLNLKMREELPRRIITPHLFKTGGGLAVPLASSQEAEAGGAFLSCPPPSPSHMSYSYPSPSHTPPASPQSPVLIIKPHGISRTGGGPTFRKLSFTSPAEALWKQQQRSVSLLAAASERANAASMLNAKERANAREGNLNSQTLRTRLTALFPDSSLPIVQAIGTNIAAGMKYVTGASGGPSGPSSSSSMGPGHTSSGSFDGLLDMDGFDDVDTDEGWSIIDTI